MRLRDDDSSTTASTLGQSFAEKDSEAPNSSADDGHTMEPAEGAPGLSTRGDDDGDDGVECDANDPSAEAVAPSEMSGTENKEEPPPPMTIILRVRGECEDEEEEAPPTDTAAAGSFVSDGSDSGGDREEDEPTTSPRAEGESVPKVPPVEAFSVPAVNGTYEALIPITPYGLLLKIKNRDGALTFDGYAPCPNGTRGPSETKNLIRKVGDVVVAVNGVDVDGMPYGHIVAVLKEIVRRDEVMDLVTFRFMDFVEWRRRKEEKEAAEKLNAAYESFERMRRANLELEFGADANFGRCTQCLRAEAKLAAERQASGARRPMVGRRLRKMASSTRIAAARGPSLCLVCGSPVCGLHSSDVFRAEKITICGVCSPLFSHDFVVDCLDITVPEAKRRECVNQMMDAYDRAVLMLRYSSQYIDAIADALDHNTKRNDRVGLGSSATGIASGVAGVVGAATIFTPVGPPLLIASLLFGGSATAVQTGSEAVNYFSEPNRLADRIIALHAMVVSILGVADVLRGALTSGQVRVDHYLGYDGDGSPTTERQRIARDAGVASVKYAGAAAGAAAARTCVLLGRNSRFVTRASTAAMRTARFARFAGGALSAATVVMEAREMSATVGRIRAGNPCEKADILRDVKSELSELPETKYLAEECESYFDAMSSQPVASAALVEKERTEEGSGVDNGDVLDAIERLEHSTKMVVLNESQESQDACGQ